MLIRKRWLWVIFFTNPIKECEKQALEQLSSEMCLETAVSNILENSLVNQQKMCAVIDGYMLKITSCFDQHMRAELVSHRVKLENYFGMEYLFRPEDFRNEFSVRIKSTTANKKAKALDDDAIIANCKTVLADMYKRFITDLKKQVAAAYEMVRRQFLDKGEQRLGSLLIKWQTLVQQIESFLAEGETAEVTPESIIIPEEKKDNKLFPLDISFRKYFYKFADKAYAIYNDLVLINYVLIQRLNFDNNIDI